MSTQQKITHNVYPTTEYIPFHIDSYSNPEIKSVDDYWFSVNGNLYQKGYYKIKEVN